MEEKTYIGIDISKDSVDVSSAKKYIGQFKNTKTGITALIRVISKLNTQFVAMEATGGYERLLATMLNDNSIKYAVVNPRHINHFAIGLGKHAKTDKIDAMNIALYCKCGVENETLTAQKPKSKELQELDDLVDRRSVLVKMITQEKNRKSLVKAQSHSKTILSSIERNIKHLNEELVFITQQITSLSGKTYELKEKIDIMCSVPGIAVVGSHTLLAKLPELGTTEKKSIAALCGLAPFNRDSGTSIRGIRKTKGGRTCVRTALHMAALNAVRAKGVFQDFYKRLLANGKKKSVALTAVARKIVIVLNSMFAKKTKFDSELYKKISDNSATPLVAK